MIMVAILLPSYKAFGDTINKVLVIYDSYNIYGQNDNILNEINNDLMLNNVQVSLENMNNIDDKNLDNYSKIVFLNCNTENFNQNFIDKINKVSNKLIYISNINNGEIKYSNSLSINYLKNNSFKFRQDLIDYTLGKNVQSNKFLMINNVNPFINLNDLVAKIKYLNEQGIPFILNTIPVFENPNFDAMKRFTEVLRYAQASGGYIVLSCPYIENENATSEEIFNPMEEGYKNYINYLVYPIAISMPRYLLYRNDMKEYVEKSNTIFIENSNVGMINFGFENATFKNVINQIQYKEIDYKNINSNLGNIAITIENSTSLNEFKEDVQNLINNRIFFNSPTILDSNININGVDVTCSNRGLYSNNKDVQQNTYISNKDLEKGNTSNQVSIDNKQIDISKISNKVMLLAFIACVLFIIITILSRRIDKRKYFK
ncbi:hypothetical protein CLTHE_22150 [Clostridium thermobutyricum DSM 4928]|uniref:DUF2334 domain-containing protein n=2 Tax=Clostridium thermobutyricum TaxID=29372 RepID=A0A1V4SUS8_9CLOT|nr:hypothetical protein CLTHE_22150 [Clostridium thermobutyricum DSM 4928]